MTIGEFGEKTRLSPKALCLYDQLGLVVPAQVDAASGYRRYSEDQVDSADAARQPLGPSASSSSPTREWRRPTP